MGCITCSGGRGRDGAPISNIALLSDANRLYHTGDFALVTYKGPSYPHPVSSPTNNLYQMYGYAKYSQHSQGGKVLLVLKIDIEARPDLYEEVEVGSERHAVICEQFNIDINYVEAEPVLEVPVLTTELTIDTNPAVPVPNESPVEKTPIFPKLTQETAMTLKEFTEQHPEFIHHLQVLAQVKAGALESEKRDDIIYIWHTDSNE